MEALAALIETLTMTFFITKIVPQMFQIQHIIHIVKNNWKYFDEM